MNKTIRVMTKLPGSPWRLRQIDNTLEALQQFVGGYIETVTLSLDVVVICNEEGRIRGLPENVRLCGVDFCGPVIVAGIKGEDFADLKMAYVKQWRLFAGEEPGDEEED